MKEKRLKWNETGRKKGEKKEMVRFVRMSFPYFQTDVISLMHGRPEGMKYSQNET